MKNYKLLFIYTIVSIILLFGVDILVYFGYFEEYKFIGIINDFIFFIITGFFIYNTLNNKEELQETKATEQRLSTLINSMVDFVNFKDGEGRWIAANEFGLKLFQLENVDYRGKKDSELAEYTSFYREALIYCEVSDEEAWKNGTITRCEEVIPMPDGSEKVFDSIKVPLFHGNGDRKGLVVIGRDITELKLAEEQLRKTEKLSIVGELAASVGHEIRNPLTSLKGFVQLFKTESNDERHQLHYDIMLSELDRINHIVGELLLLAKPQTISFKEKDVNSILADVFSLLETQANMHNVNIMFNPKEELVIDCSENQLKQLFINIIKNAIEASSEKSNVTVTSEKYNEDEVLIVVEDRGVGLSEEFLTRIGEPFYSSKEKGTGLGLTVSMKIVEQHRGTLNFQSEKNVGTIVEIVLPIKNNQVS